MRSFIKDVLRKRVVELKSIDQAPKKDDYEKRLRIFIDEIIQLSIEQKCFTEEEMISESLTMLLAVSSFLNIVNNILQTNCYQIPQAINTKRILDPIVDSSATNIKINSLHFRDLKLQP